MREFKYLVWGLVALMFSLTGQTTNGLLVLILAAIIKQGVNNND